MQLAAYGGSLEGWTTLDARSLPFLVGNSPEQVNWECECGATLATNVYARQVLNVLIRCGACSALLESPHRSPGAPISGRPVYLPPGGTYLLSGALDVVDKPVMIVGHSALLEYAIETGRTIPGIYDPGQAPIVDDFSSSSLFNVARQLRSLLGAELERLREADARGQKSHTPPNRRHRVIELIEFAERTARELDAQSGSSRFSVDGNLLAESITLLAAASRWVNHPAWPALQASLASGEAVHTGMLLTIASYLVDANNGVGVHVGPSRQNATTADIWTEPDLSQRVDLEVKTPMSLRGPREAISEPHAITVLERALKKSSRQRRNTRSSLLAVGGYHMGASYNTMVSTAKAILALERRKWRGLAGILIVNCTYEITLRPSDGATQFAPVAQVEIALHPGYSGGLSIQRDVVPTSTFSQGEALRS